jgi:hypothetical protein
LAYRNVFAEFIGSQLETLRLLPISAGCTSKATNEQVHHNATHRPPHDVV